MPIEVKCCTWPEVKSLLRDWKKKKKTQRKLNSKSAKLFVFL